MPPVDDPARRNARERQLLRTLHVATVLLLALFLLATIRTFNKYSTANKSVRDSNAVMQELGALVSALKDAQTGARGFILTHDTTFMRPFRAAQPVVEQSIHNLDSLSKAGATKQDLRGIEGTARQLLKRIQEQFLSEHTSDVGLQGNELEQLKESRRLMERVRAEHDRLATELDRMRDANLLEERSLKPDTPMMLVVYSVLVALATSLLFWRLFRALAKAEKAEGEIQRKVDELNKEVRTREFAERSLKRVLDTSPSSIMAFRSIRDLLGRVVDFEWVLANRESQRVYGLGDETLIGKHMLAQLPWVGTGDLFKELVEVVESGMPYEVKEPSAQRPGTWVHLHAVRLLDGLVMTVTDISETRRAQELLAEEDRLAITGGIARTIAHEVRNPLTNLHLALEQMLEELAPEVRIEVSPYSDILQRNMRRISQLITDLLESSKARDLDRRPCPVMDLLEVALASVQDRLDLRGMQAEVQVDPEVGPVLVDEPLFGVALTNLCVNAIEAMEDHRGRLTLVADIHHGHTRILVADNGKGIAEENIQLLFQAFYSGRSGGMGLGLTSARAIFNAHGVHVDVKSTVGVGTAFELTFPE